ncbi:MAG: hypothetical protein JEZ11_23940 [Desulfobacterales bacterium]|nr:hypothetical protein [Desulfobacterales bacterium]
MTDNQKTEKPFDLDALILPEAARIQEALTQDPVPSFSPEPDPKPSPDEAPVSPQSNSREAGDAAHGLVSRPARIILTTLVGVTALIWLFLLLIYLWDWILR